MSKMIKTTDTDVKVDTTKILVVEIGTLSFELDERFPWIDVYLVGGESKEFVTQIDEENMPVIVEHEELIRYCLNWYFNNVEIIASEELERTAQEVPVQEQLVTLEVLNNELNINLSQKQYEEIAILDFCTPKYTAYEILKLLKTLSVI
ncbi:hypothetical protein ACQPUY_07750 [Clostridium nigeriense]|uniref:hypothetical protein n=1 Tax=Clostridium nigeriense TaxID=1805470 RepID=UPI003D33FCD2